MKQANSGWTLFEFVGGPRDGELSAQHQPAEHGIDEYVARSNPPHLAALFGWEQAAERAMTAFGSGVPDRYVRMIWDGARSPIASTEASDIAAKIASQVDRLQQALRAGEDYEARLIAAAFCAHTPSKTALIESLIAPALRNLGQLWAKGTDRLYVRHRAIAIVHGILGDHSAASTHVVGHRVVVATVTGEVHTLPARMAAIALREDGWQVEEVSGALPPDELAEAAAQRGLDLVVISTTAPASLPAANRVQQLLEPLGIPVIIGTTENSLYELQRLARRVSLATAQYPTPNYRFSAP